jgi:excisionase family DNA binding protein
MTKGIFRGARELAAYIGASENAVHLMVARGRLPVHRHGRTLVFLKDEIDDYFAGLPGVRAVEAHETVIERPRAGRRGSRAADPERNAVA